MKKKKRQLIYNCVNVQHNLGNSAKIVTRIIKFSAENSSTRRAHLRHTLVTAFEFSRVTQTATRIVIRTIDNTGYTFIDAYLSAPEKRDMQKRRGFLGGEGSPTAAT